MIECVEISKTICVTPSIMDENIMENIANLVRQKYEKTCDKDDGLILSIDSIVGVENQISKDSCHINVSIKMIARVVRPKKGMCFTFRPTLIISKGIFGKIYESISLFIPDTYLTDWVYKNDTFIHSTKEPITKQNDLEVCVTDIKFNATKYNCICKLA